MIKLTYWRYHEMHEDEYQDNEIFDCLRFAIFLSDHCEAWIESITLPNGTILDGVMDAEEYYDTHGSDEHAIEGSAIVLSDRDAGGVA